MPLLWRYLLYQYLRVFSLSVCSFIATLFVSRFKDGARFAAVTADWSKTALFMAYHIPAVLPVAIPLSSLIAAFLLFQNLSRNYELSAFRSSGISLPSLFAPFFFLSLFLSLFHFVLCAEIAPYCRRESRTLLYRETSANPLLLLQRQRLVKIPDISLRMKVTEDGKTASDFLLIAYNEFYQTFSMIFANRLHLNGEQMIGTDVALITPIHQGDKEAFLVENQSSFSMQAPLLTSAIKKNRPTLDATTLGLRMLRLRILEGGKAALSARIEILRRSSLSMSLFTFTLLGFAFGIELNRSPIKRGTIQTLFLTLLVLICYLLGHSLKYDFSIAAAAYLLPHPVVWICSAMHLRKIGKGIL